MVDALYHRMMDLKNCERRTLSPLDIFYDTIIMRGPDSGTVVFKALSENRDYTEALTTQDWCSDFSYWNNTDRDDNVSEEEWESAHNTGAKSPTRPSATSPLASPSQPASA